VRLFAMRNISAPPVVPLISATREHHARDGVENRENTMPVTSAVNTIE
jgi:hypothetical protein